MFPCFVPTHSKFAVYPRLAWNLQFLPLLCDAGGLPLMPMRLRTPDTLIPCVAREPEEHICTLALHSPVQGIRATLCQVEACRAQNIYNGEVGRPTVRSHLSYSSSLLHLPPTDNSCLMLTSVPLCLQALVTLPARISTPISFFFFKNLFIKFSLHTSQCPSSLKQFRVSAIWATAAWGLVGIHFFTVLTGCHSVAGWTLEAQQAAKWLPQVSHKQM